MKAVTALLASLALALCSSCGEPKLGEKLKSDQLLFMSDDHPAMAAAFRKSKATLNEFLESTKSPSPTMTSVAVKVALTDGKETEYFWITPFERLPDGRFTGEVNNTPVQVRNYSMGQKISFSEKEIVDWMYYDKAERKMHGNFTLCALLTVESKAEADEVKRRLGLQCDS